MQPIVTGLTSPTALALAGDTVVWGEGDRSRESGGSLKQVSTKGGPVSVLASGLDVPCGISVDAKSLYYLDYAPSRSYSGVLWKLPRDGGAAVKLLHGFECGPPFVQDESALYMSCSTSLMGLAK